MDPRLREDDRKKIFFVSLCEICLKVLSVAKKLTCGKCVNETQKY
jgi:hypothetical protein